MSFGSRLLVLSILFSPCVASAAAFRHLFDEKNLELGIGSRIEQFSYAEDIPAPGKSTETARFASLLAQARIFAADNLSNLQLRYEAANGVPSDYEGSDLNTGAPASSTDPLSFLNAEVDVNVALGDHFFIYVGYGYRVWNRFLSGGSGYREIYSWFYTPVGFTLWFTKGDVFDFGVDGSVRPMTGGTIQVITSQNTPGGSDTTMTLGSKTGYRAQLPMNWHWQPFGITVTPWYEHSEIGQSNTGLNATLNPNSGNGIYEPNSKTDQFGVEAMLTFTL